MKKIAIVLAACVLATSLSGCMTIRNNTHIRKQTVRPNTEEASK